MLQSNEQRSYKCNQKSNIEKNIQYITNTIPQN